MPQKKLQAIVGARVSRFSDEKVSHTAQLEAASRWAKQHDCTILATFEDLGISADIPPEERPGLGEWLKPENMEAWQIIVFSRLDRAFRSIKHCVDFARQMEAHGKMLVFAEDGLQLDYRPGAAKGLDKMMAELFVVLGSFFAQVELARFKERALDRHSQIRQTSRWASGVPPLGYRVIPHPSGKGKGLTIDTEGKKLLQEMSKKLLSGESFIGIAAWLNQTGALTNMDKARIANGKPAKRKPWTTGTVIEALTSPKTQGLKTYKGQIVLDGEGESIRLGPPIFDPDTWTQMQAAAELRRIKQRQPLEVKNPLLGIGFCGCTGCESCDGRQKGEGICGASLAQQISRRKKKTDGEQVTYRTYRCGRTPRNCNGISMNAGDAEEIAYGAFLEKFASEPVTRQVFQPGTDNSHELDRITESIARLRRESDAGLLVTEEDEAVYIGRMKALIERRTALEEEPNRKAAWIEVATDQTYAEAWDTIDRRQLLIDRHVTFLIYSGKPVPHTGLFTPDWEYEGPAVDIDELNRIGEEEWS
jgi:site-specific DNA recombinase